MEKKEMFKDKVVDFWKDHKHNLVMGVLYTGCAIIGYKAGKACYNLGYIKGANDVATSCEKYIPEANVTSTLKQIAVNQTKK